MLDTTLPKCRPEWPTSTLELGSALRALRAQRHSNNCAAAVIPLRRAVADVLPARPHSEGAGNLARSVPGSVSDARSPGGARAHGLRADVKQVDIIAMLTEAAMGSTARMSPRTCRNADKLILRHRETEVGIDIARLCDWCAVD